MRYVNLRHDGGERLGLVVDDQVVLLLPGAGDLVAFIGLPHSERQALIVASLDKGTRLPLAGASLAAPIRRFRRDVLCTGWNYWDHFEESKGKREGQDVDRPKAPTFFTKSPDVVIGPQDDIAFDARISLKWDYEAEIAIIIGKGGRSIPRSRAHEHIFGFCLANDVSQRDLQRRHGGQWLKGKSIDGTMPLGPHVVTPDEIELPKVRLQCLLNGELMQNAVAAQMAFPVDELIAELSFGMTLHPGDVLLTGTPSGIGNAREPQVFLKAGDEVVVRAEGLGELRNRLVAHDLAGESDVAP
ncbi:MULTISPECIES: fumarylacetoacetate hydrolase family protein [unclassified Bosea (in: a-proteobacteria)]|uniref:fumarylacetoacetate hydrolase family protein n=1 Tax=unclassified Bosea (in: a-proteobacteria) TaxID=2653178 RepID=UPI000F762CEF|nr:MULTISPECIES: fumarylacetoacetate hydrolase family protein [unclassified Bosea (in: a-proteobacteria)]AZO80595.1 5-carboxymethyl-2-hydroxymuconate isomerase [Bosea sp. Tri-49]RXT23401.1 5-carboxymethyl-2-hydroxymuconate isomerase [Bosea sp. Tri-39]RXT38874.1 5-carboxymethyl-2-hydroxymuconate isomerase [Bosea sp. Tri-54]